MSSDGYNSALAFVLHWEGGLTDDPDDPGGRTNKGITQAEYDAWRRTLGVQIRDVADIEDTEIQKIYWTDYWLKASCTLLIQKLDLLQFDTAVNVGSVRAIRFLQSSAGCVVDGIFGVNTATAVSTSEYIPLVTTYCNARASYYAAIVQKKPKLRKFLKGWLNRLDAVRNAIAIPGYETFTFPGADGAGHGASIPDYGVDPTFDL